jgi:phage shock protein E
MSFFKKIFNTRDKSVDIDSTEFSEKMKIKDAVLIDIRTPVEFNNLKIEGAINIDYYRDDFLRKISKLDKNKTILLYCRSGNRSHYAVDKIKEMGFTNSFHLKGGIVDWINNKNPVI